MKNPLDMAFKWVLLLRVGRCYGKIEGVPPAGKDAPGCSFPVPPGGFPL